MTTFTAAIICVGFATVVNVVRYVDTGDSDYLWLAALVALCGWLLVWLYSLEREEERKYKCDGKRARQRTRRPAARSSSSRRSSSSQRSTRS